MEITRKNRKHRVLRENWYTTDDGKRMLLLTYPLLDATGLVTHCFTTRYGGVSEGIFSSMNLSFTRGDDEAAVRENYKRLASALGVKEEKFVFSDQTHTTNIRKVTAADAGKGLTKERDYRDVDGLITDVPGIVLSTLYADCVPLYVVDPVHRAIGLSHSGWRGTVGRMGAATVEAMRREYGSRPEDLLCAIGPSICQDCYEVGEEVAAAFAAEFAAAIAAESVAAFGAGNMCATANGAMGTIGAGLECGAGDMCVTANGAMGTIGAGLECGAGDMCVAADGRETEGRGSGEDAECRNAPGRRGQAHEILRPGAPGKYQLNLWRANEIVLTDAGVLPEHIAVTDICTCCNPKVLFSHRASHGRRGNLGAFLCLNE